MGRLEWASYRSGTAYVGIIGMVQKLKKIDFFRVPANHSFTAQTHFSSAPWKSTEKITVVNFDSTDADTIRCFARFFITYIGRTDGWTRDRLKLQILNKKRRRCAPAQKSNIFENKMCDVFNSLQKWKSISLKITSELCKLEIKGCPLRYSNPHNFEYGQS